MLYHTSSLKSMSICDCSMNICKHYRKLRSSDVLQHVNNVFGQDQTDLTGPPLLFLALRVQRSLFFLIFLKAADHTL